MDIRVLKYCDLGLIDYQEAWDIQKHIFEKRYQDKIADVLFLLEHPHTYTLGKVADKNHLIGSDEFLKKNKISIYDIDRGGDITYHGPGQIVGYPIINLNEWQKDTHKYLRSLEEVLIKVCEEYGLKAERNPKYTGVWVKDKKIAAIGIKVSRWITMHGFAFNVNTNLDLFQGIIPCGINDKDVTSLEKELGGRIDLLKIKSLIKNAFMKIFNYKSVENLNLEEVLSSSINNEKELV